MRVLVVGAGAIGGYFGGRLLQAGADITFLVRSGRAKELATDGLIIRSPNGDVILKDPARILSEEINESFDLILLSCKAYDLDNAIQSFAAAVGPQTLIIPMLNGMKHLDILDAHFGQERVMGGLCTITATLNEKREIVQMLPNESLRFGSRHKQQDDAIEAISQLFESGNFNAQASATITHDMWEKWMFLASLAAATCLMRAPIGVILAAAGGQAFISGLIQECTSVTTAEHFPPRPAFVKDRLSLLMAEGSPLNASMFRDIKAGARVEADNIIGDLILRAEAATVAVPLLRVVYTHLKSYELQS